MTGPDGSRSYSLDPGWYTEPHQLVGVPTDVLQAVWHNAKEAYMTAGGHNHAARMQRVMRLVDEALTARGVDISPRP